MVMNTFGERLLTLRSEKNLSRLQLATALNVSVRLIGYWENNQRECDFKTLIKIADYFSVSTDYLLGRTDY
ncbi:MAG: helix-turn-helix domain-containing protein [Ruminococcus flavefaciens]|nr:helix-turn-helix domain-containing protein [Ruminococcus flavefaciens]